MKANEVAKWSPADWKNKVAFLRPSGGGAVGVAFVWTGTIMSPLFDHKNLGYGNPGTCDFVLKPQKGNAATTKLAEKMLTDVAKMGSPNSHPIARNSPCGRAIMELIYAAKNGPVTDWHGKVVTAQTAPDLKDEAEKRRDRWNQVFAEYNGADYFLIQDAISGQQEMGDVIRTQSGLRHILRDKELITNLGKVFVADAVLGNGDRLCQLNTGNIMFSKGGKLWAIDSSTVLTGLEAMQKDFSTMSWGADFQGQKPDTVQWVNTIVNSPATQTPRKADQPAFDKGQQPRLLPGFAMKTLFEPDRWWEETFKGHLNKTLTFETQECLKTNTPPPVPPRPHEWDNAKVWFKAGVEEALRTVDQKLSRFDWLSLKSKYKSYVAKYGGSDNVDWTNLKIRRMYIKARSRGMSHELALEAVQDYAKFKFPGV